MLAQSQMTQQQATQVVSARIPTDVGEFQLALYENSHDTKEHMALIYGDVSGRENVLVRIHSECFTGDVLGSLRCDCGEQLQRGIAAIAQEESGIILYLRQEGRGIGLAEKLKAYNLQDQGYDTLDANLLLGHGADERDYTVAAEMLRDLGIRSIRLITNNPAKIEGLEDLGIHVTGRVPSVAENLIADNAAYLQTKVDRMRHLLSLPTLPASMGQMSQTGERPADSPMPFIHRATKRTNGNNRPSVTLSYAQTLDGAITNQQGRPTIISGRASLKLTHELRAAHDGILVGINTVLSDDPRLTVRLVEGENPTPIVLDSCLRIPLTARLLQNGRNPIILTSKEAPEDKEAILVGMGATVIRIPCAAPHRLSLSHALDAVYAQDIHSLMVEGGAFVIQSFLTADLVDQAVITVSPRFMGGYHVVNGVPLESTPTLDDPQQMRLEDDIVLWGPIKSNDAPAI